MQTQLYYEFNYAQSFKCSDYQVTLLELANERKDKATSDGNFVFVLFVVGAITYYMLLLQGYSKYTGKPRLKWAFSGELLKPRPRWLRQNKKGNAPTLGADLDIKTLYKDLFRHPWTCLVCHFEKNDPGWSLFVDCCCLV
jgi:hypothetical protein